jgi:hypothetical protein
MKDDDTQILPCISVPEIYEEYDKSLKYPVLGAFMNVRARELRTHQNYWNKTSHSNRLRIIADERKMQSEMRDFIID